MIVFTAYQIELRRGRKWQPESVHQSLSTAELFAKLAIQDGHGDFARIREFVRTIRPGACNISDTAGKIIANY